MPEALRSSCPGRVVWMDAGGVLFDNVVEDTDFIAELADAWRLPPAVLLSTYTALQPSMEVGAVPVEVVWRSLLGSRFSGETSAFAARVYRRSLRPNEEGWRFVKSLAGRFRLILTNNEIREWDAIREEAYPSSSVFDDKVTSGHVGVAKPDEQFFLKCLAVSGQRVEHVCYFDDDPVCVEVASAMGIEARLWSGPEDGVAWVNRFGKVLV